MPWWLVVSGIVAVVAVSSLPVLGFVIPAEVALAVGASTAPNVAALVTVILAATIAGSSGDMAAYVLGRHWRAAETPGRVPRVLRKAFVTTGTRLRAKPGTTLLVQRWHPPRRGAAFAVAGYRGMPVQSIAAASAVGAFIWATVLSLSVFFAGQAIAAMAPIPISVVMVVMLLRTLRRRRQRPEAAPVAQ